MSSGSQTQFYDHDRDFPSAVSHPSVLLTLSHHVHSRLRWQAHFPGLRQPQLTLGRRHPPHVTGFHRQVANLPDHDLPDFAKTCLFVAADFALCVCHLAGLVPSANPP